MRYLTAPQIARLAGCHRDKPVRLAKVGQLDDAIAPGTERNPGPWWLIPATEANIKRLSTRMPAGRPRKGKG